MQTPKKFILLGAFLLLSTIANANTPTLNDDETRLSICTMISQGSLAVATARQKGVSKAEATQTIDTTLVHLKNKFRHGFIDYIAQVWYADIERMYEMPVLESVEEKIAFAQIMEELSHSECMGKTPNIDL